MDFLGELGKTYAQIHYPAVFAAFIVAAIVCLLWAIKIWQADKGMLRSVLLGGVLVLGVLAPISAVKAYDEATSQCRALWKQEQVVHLAFKQNHCSSVVDCTTTFGRTHCIDKPMF